MAQILRRTPVILVTVIVAAALSLAVGMVTAQAVYAIDQEIAQQLPQDEYFTPEEGGWIDKYQYARAGEGEGGLELKATEVKIQNQTPMKSGKQVISKLKKEGDDGWSYDTLNFGTAKIQIQYTDQYNKKYTHTFTVHVGDTAYRVEIYPSDGVDTALPGDSITISAEPIKRTAKVSDWDPNEWDTNETSEGLSLGWSLEYGNELVESLTADKDDPSKAVLKFKSQQDDIWESVGVLALVYDQTSTNPSKEVWEDSRDFYVESDFFQIYPAAIDADALAELGDTLFVKPELRHVEIGSSSVVPNVDFEWHDIEDRVSVKTQGDGYLLTRTGPEDRFGLEAHWTNEDGEQDSRDVEYRLNWLEKNLDCYDILFDGKDWKCYSVDAKNNEVLSLQDLNITVEANGHILSPSKYDLEIKECYWDDKKQKDITSAVTVPYGVDLNDKNNGMYGITGYQAVFTPKAGTGYEGKSIRNFEIADKCCLERPDEDNTGFEGQKPVPNNWNRMHSMNYFILPDGTTENSLKVVDGTGTVIPADKYKVTYYRRSAAIPDSEKNWEKYCKAVWPETKASRLSGFPTTPGYYFAWVEGLAPYYNGFYLDFDIQGEANPAKVTAKKKTVKAKKAAKKAQKVKPITVKGNLAKPTYKIISYGNAKAKKALKINASTGKVTVAKKTKAGTYKATVRVYIPGDATYMPCDKAVTITIKVK